LLDTADAYGRSEEVLGPLLEGLRDELMIASKVGLPIRRGPNTEGTSRPRVNQQIVPTLRRLGTDWIDVCHCRAWHPVTPPDETLSALHNLVSSGKVRYHGVSNFFGWQIAMALGNAALHDGTTPPLVTTESSLVERGVERDIQSLCVHQNLALMQRSPLGGGVLSGKYRGADPPAEGTRASSVSNSTATVRGRPRRRSPHVGTTAGQPRCVGRATRCRGHRTTRSCQCGRPRLPARVGAAFRHPSRVTSRP
jgi:aryl-alcohol dehydrogenase-like predicted oxidoreductase